VRRLDEAIAHCASLAVEEIVAQYRRRLRAAQQKASDSHDSCAEASGA
jgi:hypothetical protein